MTVKSTIVVLLIGAFIVVFPSAVLHEFSYWIWVNEDSKGTAAENPDFVPLFLPLASFLAPVILVFVAVTLVLLWATDPRRRTTRE
ncbi:hypothetical protein [Mycetocola zhujimingii]|uniref:Uncharacterized protein n=1 Tax=Mycetocola zhujimingii TaxID=2079792 RepID=A0A2U1TDJ2_9MICO|nr:hypothetical protein [Mycetocola zhujimingii]PWC06965.1 hypothetical protein DF223_08295 [Mycetocola zhujimingii]